LDDSVIAFHGSSPAAENVSLSGVRRPPCLSRNVSQSIDSHWANRC
jgi:hypothetical protein